MWRETTLLSNYKYWASKVNIYMGLKKSQYYFSRPILSNGNKRNQNLVRKSVVNDNMRASSSSSSSSSYASSPLRISSSTFLVSVRHAHSYFWRLWRLPSLPVSYGCDCGDWLETNANDTVADCSTSISASTCNVDIFF